MLIDTINDFAQGLVERYPVILDVLERLQNITGLEKHKITAVVVSTTFKGRAPTYDTSFSTYDIHFSQSHSHFRKFLSCGN